MSGTPLYVPEPHDCPQRPDAVFKLPEGPDTWVRDRWGADRAEAERKQREFEAAHPGIHAAPDDWRFPGEIPRSCSYCGGTHPEDAIRLRQEGWEVDATGKFYKRYLNPPGYAAHLRALGPALRGEAPVPEFWHPTPPVTLYTWHFDEDQVRRFNAAAPPAPGS